MRASIFSRVKSHDVCVGFQSHRGYVAKHRKSDDCVKDVSATFLKKNLLREFTGFHAPRSICLNDARKEITYLLFIVVTVQFVVRGGVLRIVFGVDYRDRQARTRTKIVNLLAHG
jgi:hypothetical protein